MKVAIIAAASSPHTVKWANAFSKRGNRVTVFSLPEDKAQDMGLLPEISVNYLGISAADGGIKKNAAELKKLLQAGGFDVANAIDALSYGFMAARIKPKKFVITLLGQDIIQAAEGSAKGVVKKVVTTASAIVCPSSVCMQKVRSLYKKTKEIFVVPPGVDIYAFDKKDVHKDESVFTFGCIKALETASGIDLLIESFVKMREQYEGKTKLKIYGKGSMETALKQQCEKAGVADDVQFMGFVPESKMPEEINALDVLCNAARSDMFGVSTIEAMACKVPVIATDTEGSSEIILNGVTGFTVKVGKVDAFAARMLECAEDREMCTKMGAKGRGDVEELYEINKCTEKYLKALEYAQKS